MTMRKANHLKLLAGTSRPDRIAREGPALPAVRDVPSPPSWMTNDAALEEWKKLAPLLAVNKLLTEGNVSLLGHACMLHGRLVEIWGAGEAPTAALLSAHRSICASLGLLGMNFPAAKSEKPNRFLRFASPRRN